MFAGSARLKHLKNRRHIPYLFEAVAYPAYPIVKVRLASTRGIIWNPPPLQTLDKFAAVHVKKLHDSQHSRETGHLLAAFVVENHVVSHPYLSAEFVGGHSTF